MRKQVDPVRDARDAIERAGHDEQLRVDAGFSSGRRHRRDQPVALVAKHRRLELRVDRLLGR